MSLELAARHLAAQGRGKDRNLVHMTDKEVAGLQALAMAQGGSLTINPETGLPEAGFLDSLLPTLIGFGASALTGGAINPLTIGLLTGAGTAAISGDLNKGLMAGLGAWGGAGLGAGLIGAGAPAGQALGAAADFATPAQGMFTQTPVAQAVQAAPTGAAPFDLSSMGTVGGGQVMQPTYTGNILAAPAAPAVSPVQAAQAVPTTTAAPTMSAPSAADINAHSAARLARESMAPVTMPPVGEQLKAGAQAVWNNPADFMTMENAKYGLAAAAPALLAAPESDGYTPDSERYVYDYTPGRVADPESTRIGGPTSELTYFRPSYTRTAARGGLMALAEGGAVSQMSEMNTLGMNMGGPMAYVPQTQINANDAAVDPYTGEKRFATGGDIEDIQGANPMSIQGTVGDEGQPTGYADGGEVDSERIEYEFDPLTRTYRKKATALAAGAVAPVLTSTTSGSSQMNPMSPQQEAYLNWEANTSEGADARENRMQNVSNLISLGVPGLSIMNALQGKPTPLPSLSAIFGTPAAYANYQARQASSPYAGLTPGSAGWSQAVNAQAESRMARQAGVGDSGGGDYGGGDNSNRSDPSAVGSMADTAGDKRGGRIGDKPHHKAQKGIAALAPAQGRFLEGPGDGVSDSIPATINGTQPARLADGEFVVPARIVSELGNGSSKAGARKLYAMMDRIQKARGKTTGKDKVAANTKAEKYLPA